MKLDVEIMKVQKKGTGWLQWNALLMLFLNKNVTLVLSFSDFSDKTAIEETDQM